MSVTLQSQHANLAAANKVRIERSDLHRVVAAMSPKGGAQHVARLLQEPPDYLLALQLRKLLPWIDHWGDTRVEKLLRDLGIGQRQDVTVGALTARQVSVLVDALGGGCP